MEYLGILLCIGFKSCWNNYGSTSLSVYWEESLVTEFMSTSQISSQNLGRFYGPPGILCPPPIIPVGRPLYLWLSCTFSRITAPRSGLGLGSGNNLGQAVHTHDCASVTKQCNLVPISGRWCPAAGAVTVGLASYWPCVTDFSGFSTYGLTA